MAIRLPLPLLGAALPLLLGLSATGAYAQSTINCPFNVSDPSLPAKFTPSGAIDNQVTVDCMAWQQFIYLNWQAVSGQRVIDKSVPLSQFGILPTGRTTVWQTYQPSIPLFNPPPTPLPVPPPLNLQATSKYGNLQVSGIDQASGPVWLTSQQGNLTYYDVRLNPNEVAYIAANGLTTASGQLACATAVPPDQKAGGFRLPMGYGNDTDCKGNAATYGDDTGTIELKAAWLILPPNDPNNARYLTASAMVTDPYNNTTQQTVGLVGLHIIRRFPGMSQILWSTFEQVDNSPDYNLATKTASDPRTATGAPRSNRTGYAYYSATCNPGTDIYKCVVNAQPGTPCTSPGVPAGCYPYNAPQQVGRTTPLEFRANGINQWIWSQIPTGSVFQYYRLIDVQWPDSPQPVLLSGAQTAPPAPYPTNMVPDLWINNKNTRVIANSVIETYVQAGSSFPGTCMDCHSGAPISTIAAVRTPTLLSVFKRARKSTPPGTIAHALATTPGDYLSSFSFVFLGDTSKP